MTLSELLDRRSDDEQFRSETKLGYVDVVYKETESSQLVGVGMVPVEDVRRLAEASKFEPDSQMNGSCIAWRMPACTYLSKLDYVLSSQSHLTLKVVASGAALEAPMEPSGSGDDARPLALLKRHVAASGRLVQPHLTVDWSEQDAPRLRQGERLVDVDVTSDRSDEVDWGNNFKWSLQREVGSWNPGVCSDDPEWSLTWPEGSLFSWDRSRTITCAWFAANKPDVHGQDR